MASSEWTNWIRNWCSKGEPVTCEYRQDHATSLQIGGGFVKLHVEHAVSLPDERELPPFDILVAASIDGSRRPVMMFSPVEAPADMASATGVRYLAGDFGFVASSCPGEASPLSSRTCLDTLEKQVAKAP